MSPFLLVPLLSAQSASALVGNKGDYVLGQPPRKNSNRGRGPGPCDSRSSEEIICFYCVEPSNTKRACWKLCNRHTRPPVAQIVQEARISSLVTISSEEHVKFIQY